MATKRKSGPIDVSGGIDIDDRGRVVNRDVSSDERKSASRKKSKSKAENLKKKRKAEKEIEESKEDAKKKKKRKSKIKPAESIDEKRSRKKKRKTIGELLEKDTPKSKRKASRRLARLGSTVEKLANTTGQEVSIYTGGDFLQKVSSESDYQAEYDHIFRTLSGLSRSLETQMTKKDGTISSRDVYALSTLYSQLRETIADLRSISDVNSQADMLISEALDPYHKVVGEAMISVFYKLTHIVRQTLPEDQTGLFIGKIKEVVSEESTMLQSQFEATKTKVVTVLTASR